MGGTGMIISGDQFTQNEEIQADVCVIGSGCGGAVVARELSEAGHSVVVLEEGGHYTREDYGSWRPSKSMNILYRENGALPAIGIGDTPNIYLLVGKCVGGSSLVNGGVCWRTPERVLVDWRDRLGISELTLGAMDRAFDRVESELQVGRVPEHLHNEGVRRLQAAALRKGWSGRALDRNVVDCDACCRCLFGCPHDAKRSVLVTYLESAQSFGTRIYSDCRAEKIIRKGNRILGVRARVIDRRTGIGLHHLQVRSKIVVLAAGSIHTPLVLMKNRLAGKSRQVGRNLTVHPSARVYARFDDPIDPWKGSFQSYAIEEFRPEGIQLINIYPSPSIVLGTMGGFGVQARQDAERVRHIGAFGGMISDVSTGRVRPGLGWNPLVTYRMLPEDKAKFLRALRLVGELWFEAGAREIYLPMPDPSVMTRPDQLNRIDPDKIQASRVECGAQHPLGTCRMGVEPKQSVVGPWGQVHGLEGLYIADGSVVPTSVAVNPQITIMAMATRIAWRLAETNLGRSNGSL